MIREEVERLRGFIFTDEELRDVIIPAICARKNDIYWEEEDNYIFYLRDKANI